MRRHAWAITTVAALLVAGVTGVEAQDRAELEVDHALTFEIETPHTDWAQPYAGETTRVLFFTNGRGTAPRECVEVMQRFDIEAEAVFWARIVDSPKSHWHGGEVGQQRMMELLEQQWDCYCLLGMGMEQMSAEEQYRLLQPVTQGAGLVLVGTDDERVLKDANRIEDLPAVLARGPVGEAYTVGEGRGIRLPGQPEIPYAVGWEVQYDYWAERLGRAILWAAGHEPRATVTVDVGAGAFEWDAPKNITISVNGEIEGANPRARLRVRTAGGPSIDLQEKPLEARSMTWQVSSLPAGEYHADARITSDAGVETWSSTPFTVTAPVAVREIEMARDWAEPGETVSGTATLSGQPGADARARIGLFDARGRELAHAIVDPAEVGLQLPVSFDVQPWMPMLLRVDVAVFVNPPGPEPAAVMCSDYRFVHVTKRHHGQFNFLIWDTPRGTLAPYAERSLAEHSVTLQLGHDTDPAEYVAANDIAWVPYTTRIMTPKTEDGIMEPFCWNDEEAVREHVRDKAQDYLPAAHHGVFVWSLGDEVTTRGSCLSRHCAAAYREYLRGVYGDLQALNDSWGTQFTEWEQVGLSKEGDNDEANALAEGNYPRWFDRQAFGSHNFVQLCQAYDEAYTAMDPQARTGFEGAGKFSDGDDLDLIIRENEFWSPYPGVADEVIRSIAPREFPRANWMGYTKDADSLLAKYWRMVTRGTDAVWFWRWDCIGRFHGWLAPDLRPYPAVKEILRDTQALRDGLGDLLLRSEMLDTEIAMLYSYPSTFACQVENGPTYGSYTSCHVAFHELLRDLGYQFRYVTDRMLRNGEFDADRFRMLILPRAEAIGPEEARVIRSYVEGGGVVVADVRPGIYDGRCKPLAEGTLDELFGIECEGRAEASEALATIAAEPEVGLDAAKVDPTVGATTGEAGGDADDVPVFITNRVGDGAAVLLNVAAGSYPKIDVEETDEAVADLMADLVSRSGAHRPPLEMRDEDGSRLRNIEAIRWRDGDIEILALFRESGLQERATVHLPQSRHVWDLRNRRYLGETDAFETTVIPCRASFFALTPSQVPATELTVSDESPTRGSVVTGSLSVPEADGLRAFKITVSAGDRALPRHTQTVIAGEEPVEFPLPLAYNDPAGRYRVAAQELFTGTTYLTELDVK